MDPPHNLRFVEACGSPSDSCQPRINRCGGLISRLFIHDLEPHVFFDSPNKIINHNDGPVPVILCYLIRFYSKYTTLRITTTVAGVEVGLLYIMRLKNQHLHFGEPLKNIASKSQGSWESLVFFCFKPKLRGLYPKLWGLNLKHHSSLFHPYFGYNPITSLFLMVKSHEEALLVLFLFIEPQGRAQIFVAGRGAVQRLRILSGEWGQLHPLWARSFHEARVGGRGFPGVDRGVF